MALFRPRHGYLLVLPHLEEDQQNGIWFSQNMRRKRHSGSVLIHNPGWYYQMWDESLEGLTILFEKWSWKEIVVGGHTLWLVPEQSAFAIVEGDPMATRKELLDDLLDRVKTIVEDANDGKSDVTEDQLSEIDGQLEGLATAASEAIDGPSDDSEGD